MKNSQVRNPLAGEGKTRLRVPGTGRFWAILAGVFSATGLGVAFLFQYVGGLQPCVLCLYQRWPHLAIIIITVIVIILSSVRPFPPPSFRPFFPLTRMIRGLFGVGVIVALISVGLAFYHVGIEQGWWPGSDDCVAPLGAHSVDELRSQLLAAPIVRCNEVVWSFLGLSMAAYNGLLSLLLALFCALGAFSAIDVGKKPHERQN